MDFEQVEDAIIAELKDKVSYLNTVETYAGQLDADIDKLIVNFPAAFVVYAGSKFTWIDGPNYQETAKFAVLCAAKNLRSPEEARKGDGGAYDIVKDVLNALTNKTLNLQMEKLQPLSDELIAVLGGIALYGVDFQTSFDVTFTW